MNALTAFRSQQKIKMQSFEIVLKCVKKLSLLSDIFSSTVFFLKYTYTFYIFYIYNNKYKFNMGRTLYVHIQNN